MSKRRVLLNAVVLVALVLSLAPAVNILAAPPSAPALQAPSWFDPAWSYRRPLTISNSSSALTSYQVRVTLTGGNFDFGHAKPDGTDVRFTDSDGTTLLSHWIESWDQVGENAVIWVKVPAIPAGDSTIYLYYGKSSATSASSGSDTFELFDDDWSLPVVTLNPVMTATQSWWESQASYPMVFEDTSFPDRPRYHMLYDGHFVIGHAKGYAWSSDLVHWTEYDGGEPHPPNPNAIMGVGYAGNAVFAWGDTMKVGDTYHMYVSQGPGTTVHAQSTDLIYWTDHNGGNVSFDPLTSSDPSGIGSGAAILKEKDGITPIIVDGKYWMIYFHGFGSGSMYLASADTGDLLTWTTCCGGSPILTPTPGTWDRNGLWTPSFARLNDTYYIYYQGMGSEWTMGFAKADAYSGGNPIRPDNVTWSKSANPVITGIHGWDNGGCQDPMIREFDGTYYLFYTGTGNPWTNGFATSTSPEGPWTQYGASSGGTSWTLGGNPTVSNGIISFGTTGSWIQSPSSYSPGRAMGYRANYKGSSGYKWAGFIDGIQPPFTNVGIAPDASTNLILTNYISAPRAWTSLGLAMDAFHVYELVWLTGETRAYIDHSSTPGGALTSSVPSGPLPMGIRNHADSVYGLEVDWIYLRVYSDPEPAAMVGGEEARPTVVTLASFTAESGTALDTGPATSQVHVHLLLGWIGGGGLIVLLGSIWALWLSRRMQREPDQSPPQTDAHG